MKMVVMGFDGCAVKLLNKWKDRLPAFSYLMEHDKLGTLCSTTPPHTAPGWTSAFTGVGSGNHGIYQFWDTQAPGYIGKFMGSSDLKRSTVWEILNTFGYKTGVLNIPMTHPPKELNGFILTWPLHNTLRYAYPDHLLVEIAEHGGHYISDLSTMFQGNFKDYIEQACAITRKRLITLKYLIEKYQYDFYVSVFTEMDRVSHFYWNYMDKESPYYIDHVENELSLAVENIYKEADAALGAIMQLMDEETLLLVLSDHGFCKGNLNFYVQSFLLQEGDLTLVEGKPDMTDCNGTASVLDVKTDSWLECVQDGKKSEIDWTRTKAYMAAPGSYGININLKGRQHNGIVNKEEFGSVRNSIMQKLRKVVHPVTGKPLFDKVLPREEVYTGDMLSGAPDIILIPDGYGTMVHHDIKPGILFGEPEQKGMHDMDGMFALYGKEVESVTMPSRASIEDISPTILSYFGIKVPEYFEGKPIYHFHRKDLKVFNNERSHHSKSNSEDSYSREEAEDAKRRLKALGYL